MMGKDGTHQWPFIRPTVGCFLLLLMVGRSWTAAEDGLYQAMPSSRDAFLDGLGSTPLVTLGDLHAYTEHLLEAAEVDMLKSFMAEHVRIRRNVMSTKPMIVLGVEAAVPFEFPGAVQRFVKLQMPSGLYVVVFTKDPALELYEVSNGQHHMNLRIPVADTEWNDGVQQMILATAYVTEANVWVVWHTKSDKVYAYCFSRDLEAVIHKQFIVEHKGITALKLFQVDNQLCLIIATDSAGISSYYLNINYFDKKEQTTLNINGVTWVETFEMHKQMYILLISSSYKQGIGLCNFNSGNMECSRPIDFPYVTQATHYVDMQYLEDHTLQNHYIIFTSPTGNHNIYFVSHGKLLFWQQLAADKDEYLANEDTSTNAAVIQTPGQEIFLCIATGQKVSLYVEDKDAEFQLDYTFTVPAVVTDVYLDYILEQGIQLYVVYGRTNPSIGIWKVMTADRQPTRDNLLECLENLDNALTAREDDLRTLKSYIEKKVMTTSGNQIWDEPLYIQSLEVKNTANLKDVAVTRSEEETSHYELTKDVQLMMTEMEDLKEQAEMLLLHNGSQTFDTSLNIGTITASRAEVNMMNVNKMNGIPLTRLAEVVLLQDVNQRVNTPINFNELETGSLVTEVGKAVTFSGIAPQDFVQDDLDHVLQGSHYFSDIIAGNVNGLHSNHMMINNISTDSIVTPGSDPVFMSFKRLNNLTVDGNTTLEKLNNITVENMVDEIVLTNVEEPAVLEGNIAFLGTLKANRNMDVSSLNFYNLSALYYNAVKSYGINIVRGPVVFEADMVAENCSAEIMNGIPWYVIALDSHDCITSSFVADLVHVMGDLEVDKLNSISLHEVALDGQNTIIDGRIEFRGPVVVDKSFTMEVNATIGGVDPSDFDILRNISTLLVDDFTTIEGNLSIPGDLIAPLVDGVNLTNLPETYWDKTLPQTFNHSVNLTSAVFMDNVIVETLNDNMPSGYLQVEKHQNITGYYQFQKLVTVDNMLMSSEVLMDQVDVSEIPKNVMTIDGNQTISAEMNFLNGLIVNMEMNLSTINGIRPGDFMLLDGDRKHTGMLTVENATLIHLHSNSNVWIQETLNGYNVDLALDIYDRNRSKVLSSNVKVIELSVNELISEDLIDTVDFDIMMQRSLKMIAPEQYVTTNLTVKHFRILGWLSIGEIGGQNWIEYTHEVVLRNNPGKVLGPKRFHELNEVVGEINAGTINGRNITWESSRVMSKTADQFIQDYLTFEDDVTIGYLRTEIMDNVNLSRTLYTNLDVEVDNLELDNPVFLGNVGAPHDIIDDCDVGKLDESLKWLEGGTVVVDTQLMVNRLVVLGNVKTSVDLVAFGEMEEVPVNIGHLIRNVVLRNTEQIITGPVQMETAVVQDLSAEKINEVDMHRLFIETASKNGVQDIRCSLNFTSGLEVNNLKANSVRNPEDSAYQSPLFNGINLLDLEKSAVKIEGNMNVDGSKMFSSQPVFRNLVATGGLNGYYAEDFVLLSSNKTVQSYCSFSAGVRTINLKVRGKIHGEDHENILKDRYTLDNPDIKNLGFANIVVRGDVNVPEVNSVKFKDLVLRHEKPIQDVNGSKYFEKGLFMEGNIWVKTFNDLDVDKLNFIVRVDEETAVPGTVVFEKSVNAPDGLMLSGPASLLDGQTLKNDLYDMEYNMQQEAKDLEMLNSNLIDAFEDLLNEIPTLYSELSSLSYKFPFDIGGVNHLQYNPTLKLVFATVKDSKCLHELECACSSVVHTLQIHEDCSLTLLDSKKLGNFFVIMDPADAHTYYDFTTHCNMTHTVTTMRTLSYSEENTVLTTRKLPWNGAATNILTFTEDITYFIILSQVSVSNESQELKVKSCIYIVGSSNDSAVEPKIYQTLDQEDRAADIDMVTVGEKRWVLVTTYQGYRSQSAEKANSTLYLWNRGSRILEKHRSFLTDHATCGRLVPSNFIELEPFIVFGQMKAPPALHKHVKELEVLHLWNGTSVSSMQTAAWGINYMEVLNIDQETYLLLLSSLHDKVSVFRLLLGNGFYKILDIDFVNPLTAKVIENDGITCLLVASSTTIISYQIHTKGISGRAILEEAWTLFNSSITG